MRIVLHLALLGLVGCAAGNSLISLTGNLWLTIENEMNIKRCQHASGKLTWNPTLANMVATDSYVGKKCMGGDTVQSPLPSYREVWGGFQNNFPTAEVQRYTALSDMVDTWYSEAALYDYSDRSMNDVDTKKFQQMIWNTTREVGCAVCNGMGQWNMACWFSDPYSTDPMEQVDNIGEEVTCNIIYIPQTESPETPQPTPLPTPQPTWLSPTPTAVPTPMPTPGPTPLPTPEPFTLEPTPLPTLLSTPVPTLTPPTPQPLFQGHWKTVGFYLRATWPRDDVQTWLAKLVATLELSWIRGPKVLAVMYVCPLVGGKKPVGREAVTSCMVAAGVNGRSARVLGETAQEWEVLKNDKDMGVFTEVLVEDTEELVDEKITGMVGALGGSMKQEPPLYDVDHLEPGSEYLNMQAMGFSNGGAAVIVQAGTPGVAWSSQASADWQPPEEDDKKIPWWVWVLLLSCGFFSLAAFVSLLVIKRQRATAQLSAVTVSEFYRTMPEGFLGPIPEEHYCYNDDLTSRSSIELDSRSMNLSTNHIQPIGRI